MATTPNHYIVILCGGTGPRLWPLSRANHPKQFLQLFSKKTLLEQTLNRARKICSSKNIFIVSNQRYQSKIESLIGKKIPKSNFLYEPAKKNTAMAIIFAINFIQKIDPNAVVTTMPSDHYIKQTIRFKKTINEAENLSSKYNQIVTIGIKPTFPNPSFGYIVPQQKNQPFSNVSLFIEKPDHDTAEKLIKKGAFWNSGIYTFTIPCILAEFQKFEPIYISILNKLTLAKDNPKTFSEIYKTSPDLPIDRAISEKSNLILVISTKSDWSDVGEWKSIYNHLKKDSNGIARLNSDDQFLEVNSKNCLISVPKNKIIGLVDVNNLAIVDTPDGLLICNIAYDGSSHVRDIVSQIVKNKKYKKYFLKK